MIDKDILKDDELAKSQTNVFDEMKNVANDFFQKIDDFIKNDDSIKADSIKDIVDKLEKL